MIDRYKQVENRITEAVYQLLKNPNDEAKLYELLLCGHLAYKSGLGLPHEAVHAAIRDGIKKGELEND